MSDALRRTLRRCTALLLVPLSATPIAFVTYIEEQGMANYAGIGVELADLCWLVLLGALGYLALSALVGFGNLFSVPDDGGGESAAGE